MALEIFVPDSSYSEQRVSLGTEVVTIEYKYNIRNESWYITVYDAQKETPIVQGLKVQPNQNLTGRYILEGLTSGEFWCLRTKSSKEPLDRNNLGIGKNYGIFFISNTEIVGDTLNDIIQL